MSKPSTALVIPDMATEAPSKSRNNARQPAMFLIAACLQANPGRKMLDQQIADICKLTLDSTQKVLRKFVTHSRETGVTRVEPRWYLYTPLNGNGKAVAVPDKPAPPAKPAKPKTAKKVTAEVVVTRELQRTGYKTASGLDIVAGTDKVAFVLKPVE